MTGIFSSVKFAEGRSLEKDSCFLLQCFCFLRKEIIVFFVSAALQAKEGIECPRERAEGSKKNAP
jgi:hypothetical protein